MFFKNIRKFLFSSKISAGSKSIYKKLTEEPMKVEKLEILQYGYPESRFLRTKIDDPIPLGSVHKFKPFIESLKLTAAENNLYSLSSPQVKSLNCIFCMHRNIQGYKWIEDNRNIKLHPNDYEVVINPRIVTASKISHYEYEECASFNLMKAKVKRPLGILVAYFDENGKPQERELFDFEARVFCHEFDHLRGIPFVHWKVSEGEIEIQTEEDDPSASDNLKITLEYYRNRLRDAKRNNPEIFQYFESPLLNADDDNFLDDNMQLDYEFKNKKKLSFEDVMLVDIEKGIKKDLKLKLKRTTQKINLNTVKV